MQGSLDYKIKKNEKGPLQRFKNQNLLIKKFGEVGLQVYKAITGKRTSSELKKDLGVEESLFDQILTFMHDAGMVELEPTDKKASHALETKAIDIPEQEEELEHGRNLEDIPPEEEVEIESEVPPLEEEPKATKKKKGASKEAEDIETSGSGEEIQPISEYEEEQVTEEKELEEKESEEITFGEKEATEQEEPSSSSDEISITAFEESEASSNTESELSPVEKIISDKYGDIGLRVYTLIDGQRTAEEIMRETGLTEPKLVEILDFMDEQGIIKLDYPKGSGSQPKSEFSGSTRQAKETTAKTQAESEGFKPIFDTNPDEAQAIASPIEIHIKAPLDIIKSVQVKAKLLLKYGEKGSKILTCLDGKNDILDIALKLEIPLYEVSDILRFMLEEGMLIVKLVSRADIRKKYGDDGYSVYKIYGKEGLMLYELIGKELTIRQMADKITKDKAKIIDMFIFIHKVLGIELPIDRDVLAKQLGV